MRQKDALRQMHRRPMRSPLRARNCKGKGEAHSVSSHLPQDERLYSRQANPFNPALPRLKMKMRH